MSRVTAAVALLLAAHLGVAGWVHRSDPRRAFASDSPSYERPALALLEDGRFARAPGSDEPEIHRTPGYPMLIAAGYALFDRTPAAIIAIQILMHGTMLALVARIARRVGATAQWTALAVLGLSVTFFATAQYLLAETFFSLQVVVFVLLWMEMRRSPSNGSRYFALALVTGLVLATMALTRPIAYYLPAIAAAVTALVARRDGLTTRRALAIAAVLLLPAVVILGAWQVRNHRVSGSAEFSQIKNVNLVRYRAAGVVAQRDGISLEAAQQQLQDDIERRYPDLHGAQLLDAAGAEARRILRAEPLLTARDVAEGFARMMLVPGENGLLHLLGVDQPTGPAGDLLRLDPPSFLRKWVLGRPGELLLFAFALAHLVTMYGLAALALWRLPRQAMPARTIVVAGVVLIAYFVVLSSGPEAYPRFRAPIVPLLAMLAGVGAQNLSSVWTRPRPRDWLTFRARPAGAGRPAPAGPS
jgi:4-amino-4-deoxy-L-arabinose transferase-like glycosyltransferase